MAWADWQAATAERVAAEAALQARAQPARPATNKPRSTGAPPEVLQTTTRAQNALARPWNGLLVGLDATANPHVALTAVDAKGESRSLRLQGEARDMASLAAWVAQLAEQPGLHGVALVSHEQQSEGAAHWLRFAVDAQWGDKP